MENDDTGDDVIENVDHIVDNIGNDMWRVRLAMTL